MDITKLSRNIGVIGVGTMGLNIINNISKKHDKLFIYNRSENNFEKIPKNVFKTTNLNEFISKMKSGLILIFIPENVIKLTLDLLSKEIKILKLENKFIVADAGNSYFIKSIELRPLFNDLFHYVCIGTSGGAKGALNGPAMMLGCNIEYKDYILDVLSIFTPYATFVGEYFIANFVKMVHNGIEYGIMGALGEYTNVLINSKEKIEEVIEFYTNLNIILESYLIKSMIKVLKKKKEDKNIIFNISNIIEQKGTGKWCIIESMKLNVTTRVIASSVYERISSKNTGNFIKKKLNLKEISEEKIILSIIFIFYCSYYEGLKLLEAQYLEDNQLFETKMFKECWRKNCIIESKIINTFKNYKKLPNFLTFFHENYENLLNIKVSKETLISDVFNSFKEISPLFFCNQSSVFFSAMQYLNEDNQSNVVGRSIQGMRDIFGQHGVYINGDKQNINWDD